MILFGNCLQMRVEDTRQWKRIRGVAEDEALGLVNQTERRKAFHVSI
jgi:hypothetical protein